MHIFLVNDDGIGTPGIMALYQAALARGHQVTLCAPATQQSAASQRITLHEPIFVKPYPVEGGQAFAVGGTPADCVRLGLRQLVEQPVDLVISGINEGYNAGTAVHYSGTVSAAREGALNGHHAIAVSIAYDATQAMKEHLARFTIAVGEAYTHLALPPATVLNINAPALGPDQLKPPVYAPLCGANFTDDYLRRESPRAGTYYWLESDAKTDPPTPGSDQDMLKKGHITLTLMGCPTDHCAGFNGFADACQSIAEKL